MIFNNSRLTDLEILSTAGNLLLTNKTTEPQRLASWPDVLGFAKFVLVKNTKMDFVRTIGEEIDIEEESEDSSSDEEVWDSFLSQMMS